MRRPLVSSPRNTLFDAAAVVISCAVSVEMALDGAHVFRHPVPTGVLAFLLSLALVVRRRLPLTVGWLAVAAGAGWLLTESIAPNSLALPYAGLDPNAGPQTVPWLPPMALFAAYSAVGFARDRRVAWVVVTILLILGTRPWAPSFVLITRGLLLIGVPALLGLYIAARRRLLEEMTERAERAEREQHLLAERARADERARLAAEMHDVVTHRVTLMVLQAGALRVTAPDETTRTAAEDMRLTGCQALEELRDLVGVLRDTAGGADDADHADTASAPVPGLTPLIAASRSAGVHVELVEDGDPALASPLIGRTAYRIVQEALTNAGKHAPGARVDVRVRYRPDRLHLTVRNSATTRTVDAALAATGSGAGLLGLRRRVELVDGALRAGPDPEGGFVVEATLPAYVPAAAPALEPAP
ncbi:sensor histidine kinase [Actinomadura scrupuli]|uniref:sensor histidine kinase n=1 Tax=Actinomadura scrupuli TaxID=559629 RepID=UPI003D95A198